MRTALSVLSLVVMTSALGVSVGACAAPDPTGSKIGGGSGTKPGSGTKAGGENAAAPEGEDRDPGEPEGTTPTTPTTPTVPGGPDGDGDGIPDSEDCDPASSALAGTRLLNDDLAQEKGFFTSADGFPQTSWSYDGTAYRQGRIIDASDTTVFNKDPQVSNVVVEVTAASTEVANLGTTLRQIFIVMGTMVNAGSLSAVGCGIEVVGGEAVTQKTSIVRLDGPTGNVATTPLQRVNRVALPVNQEYRMKAALSAGTLTCTVTIGAETTTATASNLGLLKGSVGLFTRQTKALFKKANICKLK